MASALERFFTVIEVHVLGRITFKVNGPPTMEPPIISSPAIATIAPSALIIDSTEPITIIQISTLSPTKGSTSSSEHTVGSIPMIQASSATTRLIASTKEILPTPFLTTILTNEMKASHLTKASPQSTKTRLCSTKIRSHSTKIKPQSTKIKPQSTATSIITTTQIPSTKPPTIYTKYSKATGTF